MKLRIVCDLQLHLEQSSLPYTLASDLLIRNIPLREGVSPDVALWPGHLALETEEYRSLVLAADLCPALILEVVSDNTPAADADIKPEIYRRAGIGEYWLYDPAAYAGDAPLCGWQLVGTEYVQIPGQTQAVGNEWVTRYPSAVLQTDWGLTADAALRLWDPQRENWYRTTAAALRQLQDHVEQAEARAEQAETRLQQERDHTQQQEHLLQQEIQRLHALLEERAGRD